MAGLSSSTPIEERLSDELKQRGFHYFPGVNQFVQFLSPQRALVVYLLSNPVNDKRINVHFQENGGSEHLADISDIEQLDLLIRELEY